MNGHQTIVGHAYAHDNSLVRKRMWKLVTIFTRVHWQMWKLSSVGESYGAFCWHPVMCLHLKNCLVFFPGGCEVRICGLSAVAQNNYWKRLSYWWEQRNTLNCIMSIEQSVVCLNFVLALWLPSYQQFTHFCWEYLFFFFKHNNDLILLSSKQRTLTISGGKAYLGWFKRKVSGQLRVQSPSLHCLDSHFHMSLWIKTHLPNP